MAEPNATSPEGERTTFKERLYDVPGLGTAMRMQDRYKDDAADQHAAAIGFFGFLSLFPLLLLVLSVAGFVLAGDPEAQARVADSVIEAIPGFSSAFGGGDSSVASALEGLSNNAGSVGLVGLVSLLFTGLKVINSANVATHAVFHVEVDVSGALQRLRQIGVLVVLGFLATLGVAATGLVGTAATLATDEVAGAVGSAVGGGDRVNTALQAVATAAGLAGSLAADFLLFVASYKLLSFGRGPGFRQVWPGALVAGVGWTLLKAFGATYVSGQISKTNELVGALGGVVGLLLLLYLAGRVYLYGAEFTALVRRPGAELASRYDVVRYEGEDPRVIGPRFVARKDAMERAAAHEGQPVVRQRVLASPDSPGSQDDPGQRSAPAATEPSPAVSAATRQRLQDLDATRRARVAAGVGGPTGLGGTPGERAGRVEDGRGHDGSADVRGAAAVGLAVGAVGALVAIAKPWKDD